MDCFSLFSFNFYKIDWEEGGRKGANFHKARCLQKLIENKTSLKGVIASLKVLIPM